jgi:PIN domain nuclease of toxin-antitoxin system
MRYVTDTHSLLWYLGGSDKLSDTAKTVLDSAVSGENEVLVPAIVIAEFIRIYEKHGQVIDIPHILASLQERSAFQITPLELEIVLGIQALKILNDLHDRLIVSETIVRHASLITCDQDITASGLAPVVW